MQPKLDHLYEVCSEITTQILIAQNSAGNNSDVSSLMELFRKNQNEIRNELYELRLKYGLVTVC
jgi:hypothetical protein